MITQIGNRPTVLQGMGSSRKADADFMPHLSRSDENSETLADALRNAIDDHKERMLRGLNDLTEEEKNAKIAEFIGKHKPVDGTEEEMAAFAEKLLQFKHMLSRIGENLQMESLITSSVEKAACDEMECLGSLMRMKISGQIQSS